MVRKRVFNNGGDNMPHRDHEENWGKGDEKDVKMRVPKSTSHSRRFYALLGLLIAVICVAFVIAFYVYNRLQHVADVTKKADLPPASVPGSYDEMAWGTYRSHLYFGLRNRHPQSPLFGMMWYEQPREEHVTNLPLRHWCSLVDGTRFMWKDHDGRSFGRQNVTDNGLALETDWLNHERSWSARISVDRPKAKANNSYAIVFYFALQDSESTLHPLQAFDARTGNYPILKGRSPLFGNFQLGLKVGAEVGANDFSRLEFDSEQLATRERLLDMTMVNNVVLYAMRRKPNGDLVLTDFQPGAQNPNFVAVQINLAVDATTVEITFTDEASSTVPPFHEEFERRLGMFRSNFSRTFNLGNDVPADHVEMGRAALSNMLGSIGYWNGYSRVASDLFKPGEVKLYGPLALLSAVPSRPTFPRGFIWDEGFHNLLIRQIDPTFSLDIISSWLDTMNEEGWIPREMVLGREAEALIPAEFLVQSNSVANPPMFFYLLEKFMNDPSFMVEHGWRLRRWYPRVKLWYNWLKATQAGPRDGSFRWRGRNSTTILELNPKTLPSGLDDFPRASHPSEKEYHLDLRCWMAMASRVLRRLCENVEDMAWIATVEEDVRHFNDLSTLDALHWYRIVVVGRRIHHANHDEWALRSEAKHAYFDYGLHSNSVELTKVRKPPPLQHEFTYVRRVNQPPKLQLVDDVFGYINLFPFLLKLLPADSPKLNAILKRLDDPNLLWTPYGLRSVAKSSPYYRKRNTEHDMPYWRGPIWINMNYLALEALQHYSRRNEEGSENAALAAGLYDSLRHNLVRNIAEQYKASGFLWEHYDDVNGEGSGTRPFTGWSALVLSIMANKYD